MAHRSHRTASIVIGFRFFSASQPSPPKFEAVVKSMGIKYTMFDGNGRPLRATIKMGRCRGPGPFLPCF